MRWFKHDSDAHTDAKLKKLRIKYGLEGYGLYWYCIELIAKNVCEDRLSFELDHDAEIIAFDTNINQERVQEMMTYMVNLALFEGEGGAITCMKLARRIDKSMTSNPQMRKIIKEMRVDTGDYSGYVYFIDATRSDERKIKVGRSKNPWQRIKEIACTDDAAGWGLEIAATIRADDCVSLETEIHRSYTDSRINNEWFEPTESLISLIKKVKTKEIIDYVGVLRHVVVSPDKIRLDKTRREEKNTLPAEVNGNGALQSSFDAFWTVYPKKTAKKAAEKAWNKLKPSPALVQTLITDCQKRVAAGAWCTKKGKSYIPNPATYINGEMWHDEIIPRADFKRPIDYSQLARESVNLTEHL